MKNELGQELVVGDIIVKAYRDRNTCDMKVCVVEEIVPHEFINWQGKKATRYTAKVRCVLEPGAYRRWEWDEDTGTGKHTKIKALGQLTMLNAAKWVKLAHKDTPVGAALLEQFRADNEAADAEHARFMAAGVKGGRT